MDSSDLLQTRDQTLATVYKVYSTFQPPCKDNIVDPVGELLQHQRLANPEESDPSSEGSVTSAKEVLYHQPFPETDSHYSDQGICDIEHTSYVGKNLHNRHVQGSNDGCLGQNITASCVDHLTGDPPNVTTDSRQQNQNVLYYVQGNNIDGFDQQTADVEHNPCVEQNASDYQRNCCSLSTPNNGWADQNVDNGIVWETGYPEQINTGLQTTNMKICLAYEAEHVQHHGDEEQISPSIVYSLDCRTPMMVPTPYNQSPILLDHQSAELQPQEFALPDAYNVDTYPFEEQKYHNYMPHYQEGWLPHQDAEELSNGGVYMPRLLPDENRANMGIFIHGTSCDELRHPLVTWETEEICIADGVEVFPPIKKNPRRNNQSSGSHLSPAVLPIDFGQGGVDGRPRYSIAINLIREAHEIGQQEDLLLQEHCPEDGPPKRTTRKRRRSNTRRGSLSPENVDAFSVEENNDINHWEIPADPFSVRSAYTGVYGHQNKNQTYEWRVVVGFKHNRKMMSFSTKRYGYWPAMRYAEEVRRIFHDQIFGTDSFCDRHQKGHHGQAVYLPIRCPEGSTGHNDEFVSMTVRERALAEYGVENCEANWGPNILSMKHLRAVELEQQGVLLPRDPNTHCFVVDAFDQKLCPLQQPGWSKPQHGRRPSDCCSDASTTFTTGSIGEVSMDDWDGFYEGGRRAKERKRSALHA